MSETAISHVLYVHLLVSFTISCGFLSDDLYQTLIVHIAAINTQHFIDILNKKETDYHLDPRCVRQYIIRPYSSTDQTGGLNMIHQSLYMDALC